MEAIKPQEDEEKKQNKNIGKAAQKLIEKEEQQLIQKISKYHQQEVIEMVENFQQEKSMLMKYLDMPAKSRNKKQMKAIKAELSYLKCFQIHMQEQDAPKEVIAIMKRDLDMLTAIISKFVHGKVYPKATILETVATDRSKVRILLRGQVAVFEPINYKSYKNCVKLHQTQQFNNALLATLQNVALFGLSCEKQDLNYNELVKTINPQQMEADDWQDYHNASKSMSVETARSILKKVSLISPTTPHRLSRHLKGEGHLVCSDIHHFVVDQQDVYEHSAICLGECYFMELQYEVYKQAIMHLNSDSEKKYIEILLKKFQSMEYFDAKQYVKKEFMINRYEEEQQKKKKQKQYPKPLSELEKNYIAVEGRPIYLCEDQDSDEDEKTKKEKKSNRIQNYQIKYSNELYLIADGQVTLQIDIIEQTRLSAMEQASKIRVRHPRRLLKLYEGDLFGFQEIGKIKEYNLTYLVKKDSRILLMSEDIYVRQFYEIPGFRDTVKSIQKERNQLVKDLISKVEKTIQEEQFKKYKSVSNLEKHISQNLNSHPVKQKRQSLVPSDLVPPRQLQYIGQKQFEKEERRLKMNIIKQKEGQSIGINLRDLSNDKLSLKESMSFASLYKNTLPKNSKIVGDFIEVRDGKGNLLRRRSISNAQSNPAQNKIFRRLGVINDSERNEHNMKVVQTRKSKYELDDFKKEKKQYDRLKQIATSLPRLGYLYAKKEELLYKNMNKLNYQFNFKN